MKKYFGLILVVLLASYGVNAQGYSTVSRTFNKNNQAQDNKSNDRLIYGGGFGFGTGTGIISLGLSPTVGYRVNDWFSAGVSLSYNFYRDKYGHQAVMPSGQYRSFATHMNLISPGIWARAAISNFVGQVHAQYHITNYVTNTTNPNNNFQEDKIKLNYGVPSLNVGLGYRSMVTERAYAVFLLNYDILGVTKTVKDSYNNEYMVTSPNHGTISPSVSFYIGLW